MGENTLSDLELERLPNPEEAALIAHLDTRLPTAAEAVLIAQPRALSVFMGMPLLADVDLIVTSEDWADGALTIAAQPDVPRNLTCTLTDANDSVAGVCTFIGTDAQGRAVTEVMTVDTGDGKVMTGTKIFASVTSCTITGTSGALSGTDVVTVGVGKVIGLPWDLTASAEVKHVYLAGTRIASPVITTGVSLSGIDVSAGTYDGAKWMQAFVQAAASV